MTQPEDTPHGTGTGGAFAHVRNGYDRIEAHDLTTADIEGATVYGRKDEAVGKISALQLDETGKLSGAVIEVGGFLGMGARSVLVPFSQLQVHRKADGTDAHVFLDTTEEQLKAMPDHAS